MSDFYTHLLLLSLTVVCFLATGTDNLQRLHTSRTDKEAVRDIYLSSSSYPKFPSLSDCRVLGFARKASCDLYPEVWIQFGIRACVCLQNSLPDPKPRCFVT